MKSKDFDAVNRRQQEFYDTKKKNLPTRLWSYFRNGALNKIKKETGIEKDIYNLHKKWLGSLSGKKILDLGCYSGNSLSFYLAHESAIYVGIDLSKRGIELLRAKLGDIPGAKAEVVDFLSEDFKEKEFDVIYAYGVLHHFKDVDELIVKLQERLRPGGIIVSHDPLQTSLPIKILRRIYRPFQTDRDWEWPFSRRTYYKFQKAFEVRERRGVLGKTKWTFLIDCFQLSEDRSLRRAQKWHREDWEKSAVDDEHMFSCMQLSILMQKKQ